MVSFNPFDNSQDMNAPGGSGFNPFGQRAQGVLDTPSQGFNPFNSTTNGDVVRPDNKEQSIYDILADVGGALAKPASTALEALSYLDKPRGAMAGAVHAMQNDGDIVEGAKKGWDENTSWKEDFNPQWVQDHPIASKIAGFATDVILDPMWLLPPARIASIVGKASKTAGITDHVINPAVKAIQESDIGKRAIAFTEDNIMGKNRIADETFDFNAGRAADQVKGQDLVDEIKQLKGQYGEDANVLNNYIEAKPKDWIDNTSIASERAGIVDAAQNGKLSQVVADGIVTREQAFNVLRDEGHEIPDFLLQEHQRQAKAAGQVIPDFIYRDQVLGQIQDPGLRQAIQTIGEKVIAENKKNSEVLRQIGWLGDDAAARFLDGDHLRRSFEKYDNAETFLKDLQKNGTQDEWRRAYADLAARKAESQGFGAAHKVNTNDFIQRQVLSEDTLKKMGIIIDPEYRVMDTLNRNSKTIREDEFLQNVAKHWGKGAEEAADLSRTLPPSRQYVPVPNSAAYGSLAGMWLPKDVAEQVMKTMGTAPDNINKTWQKLVSWWKVGKLVNPASVMRNFYSGMPMANVFGDVPMKAMPQYMTKIAAAYAKNGKNDPLIREIRSSGILGNTWAKQDLQNIIGNSPKGVAKVADIGMQAFGAPDQYWRAVVYAYHRDQGKSAKEAAKIANRALLDYSQAPGWVNWLSKTGMMPFAKFPYAAGKETIRAAWNKPAEITKYLKPQNQVNSEDREQILPDYLKASTLLPLGNGERMVNGKPQKVQNNLDLSYILPFANDLTLGNPVIDALMLERTGKNGIGQQVIKLGMSGAEKTKAWAEYLANSLNPAVLSPYTIEKLYNAYHGNVDGKGRQYDMPTALAQTVLGLKNVPINEEELYKQKIGDIKRQQSDTMALMRQLSKDQSLSKEQRSDRLKEYGQRLKVLESEAIKTRNAYNRLTKVKDF